ncbi:hypothetical protein FRB90_009608 [Tulasnella sp. 427]|nr:hypothetical protein FRB90_009608 [Tulasnella sp. 427]
MGVVRFSGKYLIEDLKDWAATQLGDNHLILPTDCHSKFFLDRDYSNPHFCVRVILFARECSLPEYLPFAFYALATEDWDRRPSEDILCLDQLDPEDRHRIHSGRLSLMKAVVEHGCDQPEYGIARETCGSAGCRKGHDISQWTNPGVVWTELLMHPIEELEPDMEQKKMETEIIPTSAATFINIQDNSYKKHHQHWYDDGNFGFLLEDVAFLLHRSVLAKRSSLMADLFSLPQSSRHLNDATAGAPISTSIVDGVPFVALPDPADDFSNVLDFIYPNVAPLHPNLNSPQDVIRTLGIARFAGKYLFDNIKAYALSQLESNPYLSPDDDGLKTALKEGLYADPELCVKLVTLSRECHLPHFLPLAFYALATADWDDSKDSLCLDGLAQDDRRRVHEGRVGLTKLVLERAHSMPENGCTRLSSAFGTAHPFIRSFDSFEQVLADIDLQSLLNRLVMRSSYWQMTSWQTSSPQPGSPILSERTVLVNGAVYTKDSRHWYEDGNFGFLVENAAYLLHRSFLARRSAVMADLFTLPQASSETVLGDLFDDRINIAGTPFIMLHDKAEDFSNILDIIYTDVAWGGEECHLDANALLGVVQISNKYLFDQIKDWAVSRLSSLQHLLVIEDNPLMPFVRDGFYSNSQGCVRIIQISRECQLPQFLPLAFYALATMDWTQKPQEEYFVLNQLSSDDVWRIQSGRLELTKFLINLAYSRPENGCTNTRCNVKHCAKGTPIVWVDPTERWRELQLHPLEELEFRLPLELPFIKDMTSSPLQSGSTTLSEGKIEVNGVTYAKHPQHWYEDGNFCFLVENTAYRLHRSLLARRSSVMADLFTLPQRIPDPDPDDLFKTPTHIDGIPVVKLHDKAEDFSNVLNIIYADITSGCEQSHLDAQALMGVVYLSHKYFFSKIKDWGVSRLSSQFLLVVKDEELRSTLRSDLYSDPKSCVQIIRFAQTCHLPQFLPLAFYALATIDWGEKSAVDFAAVDELSREDRWRAQEGKSTLTKALRFALPLDVDEGTPPEFFGTTLPNVGWSYSFIRSRNSSIVSPDLIPSYATRVKQMYGQGPRFFGIV